MAVGAAEGVDAEGTADGVAEDLGSGAAGISAHAASDTDNAHTAIGAIRSRRAEEDGRTEEV